MVRPPRAQCRRWLAEDLGAGERAATRVSRSRKTAERYLIRTLRRRVAKLCVMNRYRSVIVGMLGMLLVVSQFTRPSAAPPQQKPSALPSANWADWVEPDFPFFSSVLDVRSAGQGFPTDNLTPRGLILNLGRGQWVAFDTDLLRVAAMWSGNGVTPKALAPGSYHTPDKKTPVGQTPAPEPDGKVWVANGIYPGWQGDSVTFADPREPAPSREEVGRGPLPEDMGRLKALRLERDGVALDYTAAGAEIREHITVPSAGPPAILRRIRVDVSRRPLWLVLGYASADTEIALVGSEEGAPAPADLSLEKTPGRSPGAAGTVWSVRVPAHQTPVEFSIAFTNRSAAATPTARATSNRADAKRWPQEVTSKITRSTSADPFVVDDIALPLDNPWRRNIRLGDIEFLKDGTGVGVTLDGDVWLIRGLGGPGDTVRWQRFASGLHEPLTLAIREEQIYVFDRNGIWRLRDTNGDGEADVHELFSNAFAQTADMREFPSTLRLAPGGEFVIAKGGQEATTIGKHNGSVLRISADGRKATVLGYGFRQPNISVNPRTGLVIASDQQGNYIPSTPLHIVKDQQFYGFLSDKLPREVYPAPIAEPLTWIPHAANASAMSQVWLFGARMGPLNDSLVHIGFNNPELFRVLLNNRSPRPQAAVVSITRAFDYPPLHGSVNPIDGQLYLAGFQILGWGTTATRLAGLGRVRYTGAVFTIPRDVAAMDKGVLLRFDVPLDEATAINPDNYSITTWHYKRTYQYGSPQFKSDDTPGIDRLAPSHVYLSRDRRAVFIGVPQMKPVMQMRVAWSLATADGKQFQENAYLTPYDLTPFQAQREGFGELTVDLSPRAVSTNASAPPSAEEGRRVYQLYGCMACHSIDSTEASRLGPTWKGLYGSRRPYAKGALQAVADEAYLRESILEPAVKVVSGYERGDAGMPSYAGVLTDSQVESLVLFIKTLK
jgi:glucose/arabinose dehydrogenase/cytochrome c2